MTKLVSRFMAWGLITTCVVAVRPFPTSAGKIPHRPQVPDVHAGHDFARLQRQIADAKRRANDANLRKAERKNDRAILAATGLVDVFIEAVVAKQSKRVFVVTA